MNCDEPRTKSGLIFDTNDTPKANSFAKMILKASLFIINTLIIRGRTNVAKSFSQRSVEAPKVKSFAKMTSQRVLQPIAKQMIAKRKKRPFSQEYLLLSKYNSFAKMILRVNKVIMNTIFKIKVKKICFAFK